MGNNHQNPDGVTDSVVPSALIIFWHQLQGFFLRDATKAAKPSVASLHHLPVICQAFGLSSLQMGYLWDLLNVAKPHCAQLCRFRSGAEKELLNRNKVAIELPFPLLSAGQGEAPSGLKGMSARYFDDLSCEHLCLLACQE